MQTALVEVLLRDWQTADGIRTLDLRILAVQHNMVMDVRPLLTPVAARLCVWTAHNELVEHGLDDLRDRERLLAGVHRTAACRTRLMDAVLSVPGMHEALAAEEVLAGELDGAVEGRVADQTHEIAVRRGGVLEQVHVGR